MNDEAITLAHTSAVSKQRCRRPTLVHPCTFARYFSRFLTFGTFPKLHHTHTPARARTRTRLVGSFERMGAARRRERGKTDQLPITRARHRDYNDDVDDDDDNDNDNDDDDDGDGGDATRLRIPMREHDDSRALAGPPSERPRFCDSPFVSRSLTRSDAICRRTTLTGFPLSLLPRHHLPT